MSYPPIELLPEFLSKELADELLHYTQNSIEWRQEYITIYERRVAIPRLQALLSKDHISYSYSKTTFQAQPITPELLPILELMSDRLKTPLNSILLNRYEHGGHYISWHQDSEPELGADPTIAALSLGATRKFMLKSIADNTKVELQLPHNSLLIMWPGTQNHWRHCLPKTSKVKDIRISLTFRNIKEI